MSNSLAIATVTAALAQLVRTAAQGAVGGADVIIGRPEAPANGDAQPRVRLYLYQVTPNAALRNADLPTRRGNGEVVQRPTAALDLHYMLAFYGDETEMEPQRMLGAVARDLHARPFLSRQAVLDAIAGQAVLTGSDLADAFEHVRLTPQALSLDEWSKLWSVFFQTPHALSVAYQGSVVLIESDDRAAPGLPVLRRGEEDRGVDTLLGPFPILSAVHVGDPADRDRLPRPPSYPSANLGHLLTFSGRNLGGATVTLRFSHPGLSTPVDIVIPPVDRTPDEMRVVLPNDGPAQAAWAAGVYSVTAVVSRDSGERVSNVLPLALGPRVTSITPNPAARDLAGNVTLTLTTSPNTLTDQPAVLLLADREVKVEPRATATDPLQFVIENAPAVSQGVARLRVDGVESLPFERQATPPPPRLVFADSQKVTIT